MDLSQLEKELVTVKDDGIAFDDEEWELGLGNVAAPVRDKPGNVIAAVGVVGPTVRLTKTRMREVVPMVKNCAFEISRELGYRGN